MELVLQKKPKRLLLDYLAQSSLRVSDKVKQVEQLYNELLRKGEANPLIKPLVERLAAELSPPDPPLPPEAEALPEKLADYEKSLKALEDALKSGLALLERVEKILPEVEKSTASVEELVEAVKPLNPSLASEAAKQVSKVRRLQELLVKRQSIELLEDLEKSLDALYRAEKGLKAEYEKAIGFIQRELAATREVLEKALAVAVLQDKALLAREGENLSRLAEKLLGLREKPQPFDTQPFYSELKRIKSLAEEIMRRSMSPEEVSVLEALAWLRSSGEGRVLEFSEFVDIASRRSGVSVEEVLKAVYRLSKTGAVHVLTRVQ